MKKTIARLMAAMLAFAAVMPAASAKAAEPELFITLNGLLQRTTTAPAVVDGVTMVALGDLCKIVGGQLTWDAKERKVSMSVKSHGQTAEMTVGSRDAVFNYQKVVMPAAPVIINDRVFAPLRFLCDKLKLAFAWDEESRVVALSDGGGLYSLYDAKQARETPPKDAVAITLKQAVDKAAGLSAALKDQKDALVLIERNKKDVDRVIDELPSLPVSGMYTEELVDTLRLQLKLGDRIKAANLNERSLREGLELQIVSSVIDIQKAEVDAYLLEEKLAMDEQNLKNTKLKIELGMESKSAGESLENTIAKDKANMAALALRQDGNRLKLNNLLGYKAGTFVTVTDFKADDTAYEKDLNKYVAAANKTSPAIAQKQMDMEYAEYEFYSYDTLLYELLKQPKTKDGDPPAEEVTLVNAVASAKRALADAKTSLEQKAQNAYNTVLQLEQNNDSLAIDYANVKRAYETAVTQYIAGYAAYYDVSQAQFGLFSAEAAFITNGLNLRAAVEAYRKAYLQVAANG